MFLPLIEITLNRNGSSIFFFKRIYRFSLVQTSFLLSPEGINAILARERDFSTVGTVITRFPKATDPSTKFTKESLLDIKEHEQIVFTQILQALTKNVEQTDIQNQE